MKRIRPALCILALCAFACDRGPEPSTAEAATSAEDVRPLPPGARAPAPLLRDLSGAEFPLAPLVGKRKLVLIFYRGGW